MTSYDSNRGRGRVTDGQHVWCTWTYRELTTISSQRRMERDGRRRRWGCLASVPSSSSQSPPWVSHPTPAGSKVFSLTMPSCSIHPTCIHPLLTPIILCRHLAVHAHHLPGGHRGGGAQVWRQRARRCLMLLNSCIIAYGLTSISGRDFGCRPPWGLLPTSVIHFCISLLFWRWPPPTLSPKPATTTRRHRSWYMV